MSQSTQSPSHPSINHPSLWDRERFEANWSVCLETLMREEASTLIPAARIRWQIEHCEPLAQVRANWEKMEGSQKLDAWKRLLVAAEQACRTVLPVCVRCGECCRLGSPTLHEEDLALLKEGKIPWDRLVTLRQGEPARSPFDRTPFVLPEERIKVAEKQGSRECAFLVSETGQCSIYSERPLQCRAQTCWDPIPARDTARLPFLLRRHIFEGIDVLLDLIAEHESRCGFQALSQSFEKLGASKGQNVEEVLALLAYEDHFRRFVSEKFTIPPEYLDLLLGRGFARMAPLFGFHVVEEAGGVRRLVPHAPGEKG